VSADFQTVTAQLCDNARWLNIWLIPDVECLFCEWEASGEENIQALLAGMHLFLIEAIYPIERLDPAWFSAKESNNHLRRRTPQAADASPARNPYG
jgi:hypothetical protein